MKISIFIFFTIFSLGCVYDYHSMIRVDNKSNNGYYVHLSCNDSLTIKNIPLLGTVKK